MRQLATERVYGANIRSGANPATLGEEYASPTTEDVAAGLHHVCVSEEGRAESGLLAERSGAAFDRGGALKHPEESSPKARSFQIEKNPVPVLR